MRFLQAKGIEISICEATVTSSVEEMLEGKKHEPPLVPWHLFPYRVARRKPGGKIPLLRYFLLEIIRESFLPLVPGDKSVFSFYLSKSGYFSTLHGCLARDTVLSKHFRFLLSIDSFPLINLNGGGILAPFRSSVCIRGEIESNLVVKKVFTSRENRVTIITWKRGGTPEKRFHVWIYKAKKIVVSCVS